MLLLIVVLVKFLIQFNFWTLGVAIETKNNITSNTTCSNSIGVQFCSNCHQQVYRRDLCNCDKWLYSSQCLNFQMQCKRKCGVCLPHQARRARTWSDCYDHSTLCPRLKDGGYCRVHKRWMKYTCKYSCGYCKACGDDSKRCKEWSEKGYCKEHAQYMLKHCRKSCKGCDCHDRSAYCKIWTNNEQCRMNPGAMKERCPLSCNICGIGNAKKQILIRPQTKKMKVTKFITSSPIETSSINSTTTTTPSSSSTAKTTASLSSTSTKSPTTIMTTEKTAATTAAKTTAKTTTKKTTVTPSSTTTQKFTSIKTIGPRQTISHQHKTILNDEHCGETTNHRVRRIVGGDELGPPRSWPFLIGISSAYSPERVDCGGSILTNWFILSAAHCFVRPGGMNASIYTIRFIEHDLYEDEGYEIFRKIDRIYIHQMYSPNYDNDLALLRLTEPIYFSKNVRPACIANTGDEVKPGTFCYVGGWGFQASGVPGPPELHVVRVPIVSWEECQVKYSLLLEEVTERMLCASGDGKTDSCEGDSGGPLVCRQAGGKFKQMGIVSWGVGCGEKHQYGVYTDLAKFRAWIDEVLEAEVEDLY